MKSYDLIEKIPEIPQHRELVGIANNGSNQGEIIKIVIDDLFIKPHLTNKGPFLVVLTNKRKENNELKWDEYPIHATDDPKVYIDSRGVTWTLIK